MEGNRKGASPACINGCRDDGWVYVDLATVRPCEVHRPEQHARWVAGGFLPTPWEWFVELEEAS